MKFNVLSGMLLSLAACASIAGNLTAPESAEWAKGRSSMDEISSGACSLDAQCATVAIGAKACGGPSSYRAFPASKAAAMSALAKRDRELSKLSNERSGLAGDCRAVADPGAICLAGRCVAAKRIVSEPPNE